MAIGDYNKTTYANGAAPAINATNLNNNENKVKELDTAVESIETWQENEKSVSTESRIFDLTGDRVPPIPDDPAGVMYFQDAWATTDGWAAVDGGAATTSNGVLIGTKTTSPGSMSLVKAISSQNKLCVLKIQSDNTETLLIRGIVSGVETTLSSVYVQAGVMTYHGYYNTQNAASIQIRSALKAVGERLLVDYVYIGTGAYRSKTIDRAGVPWTNFGALPVDGPFGKGLRFDGNAYLQAPGPMIGTTGTIACRFKRGAIGDTQILCGNHSASPVTGFNIVFEGGNLRVRVYSNGTNVFTHIIATISDTNDHDLSVEFTGSAIVSVLDGVKTQTPATVEIGSGFFTVGRNPAVGADYFSGTIYAVRADSRVWTDEEIARLSRDPYSEESIPIASTPTANAIMQWSASGNFYLPNTGTGYGIEVINPSTGDGVHVSNSSIGRGVRVNNYSTGRGVHVDNLGSGYGVRMNNYSTGYGVYVDNLGSGYGVYVENNSTGRGVSVNNNSAGDGVHVTNSGNGYGVHVVSATGSGRKPAAKFTGNGVVLPYFDGITTEYTNISEAVNALCPGARENGQTLIIKWLQSGSPTSQRRQIAVYADGAWRVATLS